MSGDGGRNILKAVILGDGGVGKTSLMHRYVSNQFDIRTAHTIGVEFLKKTVEVDGKRIMLQIWDTAGQERFRSLRTPFYRGADVCMLTFSVADRQTFDDVQMWLQEFLHHADVADQGDFPFVLVGNKCDLEKREVPKEDALLWCSEQPGEIQYVETSAKTAHNVHTAFELLVQKVVRSGSLTEHHDFVDPAVKLSDAGTSKKCNC